MLQTDTHGNAFGFELHSVCMKPTIDITGRMTGRQNDGSPEGLARIRFNAYHLVLLDDECVHTGFEMHFATAFQNGVAHVFDDTRKLVRTNVRVGIHQDRSACSMLAKNIQNLVHISTLLASGI